MTKNEYPHFNPQNYDINVKIATVRSGSHSKFNINYHIVWIPKYRRKMLVGRIVPVLKTIIQSQCELMQLEMLALEVMPDHIHLEEANGLYLADIKSSFQVRLPLSLASFSYSASSNGILTVFILTNKVTMFINVSFRGQNETIKYLLTNYVSMENNKLPQLDKFQRNALAFACKWMLPEDTYTLRTDNAVYVFYAIHRKATLSEVTA